MNALGNSALPALSQDERYAAMVEKLKRLGVHVAPRTAWKQSFGSMEGSEHFDEAVRLGAEWRDRVNRGES
ncbi:hypothetical protein [Prosthecobacter sp.]|uniref:hypothetical protein n=1 Tax=Prosthecobacter sp. TaxID=1965333 RepID=UPI0037844EB6